MKAVMEEKNEKLFSDVEWEALSRNLQLTDRQAQIVLLILEGRCDKQIAGEVAITVPTVRSHLKGIFHKLKVQTRQGLILKIFREYLVRLRRRDTLGADGIFPDTTGNDELHKSVNVLR
jgi:DNA-binding NarL/FixJ family response regulator